MLKHVHTCAGCGKILLPGQQARVLPSGALVHAVCNAAINLGRPETYDQPCVIELDVAQDPAPWLVRVAKGAKRHAMQVLDAFGTLTAAQAWCHEERITVVEVRGKVRRDKVQTVKAGGRPKSAPKSCKHPGCTDDVHAKGYCNRHYQQHWRGALHAGE